MRLINTRTLELVETRALRDYAILSHVWRPGQEVTFQEMQHLEDRVRSKSGIKKIEDFCRKALELGLEYGWVDTCCINKLDPTELAEAINSMFEWYQKSHFCLVCLHDVSSTELLSTGNSQFDQSVWFERGWTLQELLAPRHIFFYSADWCYLGAKLSCLKAISAITNINESALESGSLRHFSVAQRMSWAARRKTTKDEDMAYCLLGIFDASMPLIYGEGGRKGFLRVQQAIMEMSDDQSILAWTFSRIDQYQPDLREWLFALVSAPRYFRTASNIERVLTAIEASHYSFQRRPFSMTNGHGIMYLIYLWSQRPG